MTYEEIDPNLLEDMEIAAIARERIATGGATSMDDLLRKYGVPIDLSNRSNLDPFKIDES
jgi:hypothetical protein